MMKNLLNDLRESNVLELDLTVRSSDIARYQAAHEELVKRIRDAGLQEIWFDPELGQSG